MDVDQAWQQKLQAWLAITVLKCFGPENLLLGLLLVIGLLLLLICLPHPES